MKTCFDLTFNFYNSRNNSQLSNNKEIRIWIQFSTTSTWSLSISRIINTFCFPTRLYESDALCMASWLFSDKLKIKIYMKDKRALQFLLSYLLFINKGFKQAKNKNLLMDCQVRVKRHTYKASQSKQRVKYLNQIFKNWIMQ